MASIYALVDPRCGSVRYVGRSADQVERLRQHLAEKSGSNSGKRAWIADLRRDGLLPEMVTLERAGREQAPNVEGRWITRLGRRFDLLNLNHAGRHRGPVRRRETPVVEEIPSERFSEALASLEADDHQSAMDLPRAVVHAVLATSLKYALAVTKKTADDFAESVGTRGRLVRNWLTGRSEVNLEIVATDPEVWSHFLRHLVVSERKARAA